MLKSNQLLWDASDCMAMHILIDTGLASKLLHSQVSIALFFGL